MYKNIREVGSDKISETESEAIRTPVVVLSAFSRKIAMTNVMLQSKANITKIDITMNEINSDEDEDEMFSILKAMFYLLVSKFFKFNFTRKLFVTTGKETKKK